MCANVGLAVLACAVVALAEVPKEATAEVPVEAKDSDCGVGRSCVGMREEQARLAKNSAEGAEVGPASSFVETKENCPPSGCASPRAMAAVKGELNGVESALHSMNRTVANLMSIDLPPSMLHGGETEERMVEQFNDTGRPDIFHDIAEANATGNLTSNVLKELYGRDPRAGMEIAFGDHAAEHALANVTRAPMSIDAAPVNMTDLGHINTTGFNETHRKQRDELELADSMMPAGELSAADKLLPLALQVQEIKEKETKKLYQRKELSELKENFPQIPEEQLKNLVRANTTENASGYERYMTPAPEEHQKYDGQFAQVADTVGRTAAEKGKVVLDLLEGVKAGDAPDKTFASINTMVSKPLPIGSQVKSSEYDDSGLYSKNAGAEFFDDTY